MSIIPDISAPISYECSKKILEQMEKNVCKIKVGQIQGTGFFCKIPFPDKNNMLPVFITNNHVINQDFLYKNDAKVEIELKDNYCFIIINLNNRMKYTNEEYDITIIEVKEEDNISDYFEIDDIIIDDILNNENKNYYFIDETIYMIQYSKRELFVSYGTFDRIYENKKFHFSHKISTKEGAHGSPILNLKNKVIGIYLHNLGKYKNWRNIGTFLNYPIKEFIKLNYYDKNKNEILLKEFNRKYKLNIKDDKNKILDLRWKNLRNEGLEDLIKINFNELKELYLYENYISDINILEKSNFKRLELLYLGFNKISDIDILEKVNFTELKELNLFSNNISDIKVLEKANFKKLEVLNLGFNKISDVNILEKVNFIELKELNLSDNNISDIQVLEKANFEKLEKLDLRNNKIEKKDIYNIKLKTKVKNIKINAFFPLLLNSKY